MTASLTLADAARKMREAVEDKSYLLTPLGRDAERYLWSKRKSSSKHTMAAYEFTLAYLALDCADLELADFELPDGVELIERFLDKRWGELAATSYNRHRSALVDFFDWQVDRERMRTNPARRVKPAKTQEAERSAFTPDQVRRILAGQEVLRDKLALRLLLHYGLRRGGMLAIQFKHFDHRRQRLTVFLKGGKVRDLPIPEPAFWHELGILEIESGAEPHHFLMQARWSNKRSEKRHPERPMSPHGFQKWWYRCLTNAGIVTQGTTKGEKPHKARHTAGQLILEATGDIKLVQKTLMHSSIQTTADIYVDYDVDQMAERLARVFE